MIIIVDVVSPSLAQSDLMLQGLWRNSFTDIRVEKLPIISLVEVSHEHVNQLLMNMVAHLLQRVIKFRGGN